MGTVLCAVLAAALAGCPGGERPGDDADPPPAAATDTAIAAATDTAALGASCTNREAGIRVSYPEGWRTNTGDGLPACSAFDPVDVSMPEASEIPESIAIIITHQPVAFERVTDFEADFTTEVRARRDTTVLGRRAIVAELEATGEGLYDRGHRTYSYFVDLDEGTLIGTTHRVDAAGRPSYEERRGILDAMMQRLALTDG